MPVDIQSLEDHVYAKLRDDGDQGLQPDDAQDLLSDIDEDHISGRIQKLLEQLAEDKPNERDRIQITMSLLQLLEAHREQEINESDLAQEIFALAKKARTQQSTDTLFLKKALELIEDADDAAFSNADITRDDAKDILLDTINGVKEADQPHGIIIGTLKTLGDSI